MAANAPQPRDEGVGAEKGGALPAARVKNPYYLSLRHRGDDSLDQKEYRRSTQRA
jgi:hypothetical protein